MWRTFALFVLVVEVAAAGCSPETARGTVRGTVTLDGAPLANGIIRFVPADGQSPTADAKIAEGKFTAQVAVGKKRVSISAPKVVGSRKMYDTQDSPAVEVVQELLPERYNARSELATTVSPGTQQLDFALTSK